jgi:S-adenosylmethionine synthetase
MIYIAESVTPYHPDKICDRISDAILDECLRQDPMSRVAVETMGGHGEIFLTGEITTKAEVDYEQVALKVYGRPAKVYTHITTQSPEISQGVNTGGAGDQGVMVGYACRDNEAWIPNELYLAREILSPFDTDGKSQVTLVDMFMDNVVLSVCGKTPDELHSYLHDKYPGVKSYCNNTGSFVVGGFDADAGLTGRKIVIDAYGPRVPVGGGAFSGKDPTKVDRSAAYMARWVALQLLHTLGADEVLVKLGYVIGSAEPVMKMAIVDGKESYFGFDCRPEAIIERFNLRRPIYLETATRGHFGISSYPWEQYEL